jgi:hypothetical protein
VRARIEIKHNEFIRDKNTGNIFRAFEKQGRNLKTNTFRVYAEKLLYCGQGEKHH